MRFRTHLLSSLALGLAVYPRRPGRLAALVAAGTLIDLDHLLLYSLRTGDWSVVGALHYDRYRNRGAGRGDNRPRYGSLRSWLHWPPLVLPACWALAAAHPRLAPVALGLSLHLLLDYTDWLEHYRERLRSGGVCRDCGRPGRRVSVLRFGRRGAYAYRALCRDCAERVVRQGRLGVPGPGAGAQGPGQSPFVALRRGRKPPGSMVRRPPVWPAGARAGGLGSASPPV